MPKVKTPKDLSDIRKNLQKKTGKPWIIFGSGTCGEAQGSGKVIKQYQELIEKKSLKNKYNMRVAGCLGFCEIEPIVVVRLKEDQPGILYQKVKPEDVEEIVTETLGKGKVVDRLLYVDPKTGKKIKHEDEIPFYKKQKRPLLSGNVEISPNEINDYIRIDGYIGLEKALFKMKPEEIIEDVKKAGIRGRGGAGFSTGMKWQFCRNEKGDQKYIICNADEGDPGAYMDRNVLESNPHSVIEGMIIGAYAIGANNGIVYVRSEYPLAIKNLTKALNQAKELGLIGKNILGSGFDFNLEIYQGAGAFVCGEETALIASIEGIQGEPRQRPPFPAQQGLWDKPTNINNVETWANIRHIINKGPEWYSKIGTKESKGTKIFSLVGKIKNVGLVEVPFGTKLKELIYDIGGGIPDDKAFKAIQTGGPSGGCIPAEHLDTPIDYSELTKLGSIMGSGGLIVMDEETCMVDVARYFINFTLDESCGKCTSCREGNARMLEILENICGGKGKEEDLKMLEELSHYVKETSLCGLGKTAPNPVLTTLRYFKDEYIEHIKKHECRAKVCKALISYEINPENCTGCGLCAMKCPVKAIAGEKKKPHFIDPDICTKCGTCSSLCKFKAIDVKTGGG
jgi:NADH-quinone oxidoreductase subunit F